MSIKIDELARAVQDELEKYREVTEDVMVTAARTAGELAKKEIEANAPRSHGKRRSGTYAKSWKKIEEQDKTTQIHVTVYSPSQYRLTHLLEHGHALRNGGRTEAQPHIAAAQEAAEKKMIEYLENYLSVVKQ